MSDNSMRYWKTFLIPIFIAISGILFPGCQRDDEQKVSEPLQMSNVAYGSDPQQVMDIQLPSGRTSSTRVVVLVHGGGWREGDKSQFASITGKFLSHGIGTISINYRYADLEKSISYVDLLSDIDNALLYLRSKSGEYVFNANNITLFGHSAGAHLALLYAYRNNEHQQVKSVVSLAAPTDLIALMNTSTFPSLLYNLVGSDERSKFEDASPLSHVKAGDVPTFCFHGLADEAVPYEQSQELYDQLKKWNSVSNKLELVENEGHDFSPEALSSIVDASITWIKGL